MSEHIRENSFTAYDQWVLPNIEMEMGEIERTAKTFSPEDETTMLDRIMEALKVGEIVDLTPDMWSRLENTDSWDVREGHMEDVLYHTAESGRDAVGLEKAFSSEQSMFMPIIVIKEDGTPYLVSGNTRLMVTRALALTPKAYIARL